MILSLFDTIYNFTINLEINSPLDQFDTDLDLLDTDINFDFILYFIWSISPVINIILDFIGSYIDFDFDSNLIDEEILSLLAVNILAGFEEDFAEGSDSEETLSFAESFQGIVLISNLIGMVPGFETQTSEASFTFWLSFLVLLTVIHIGFSIHSIRFLSILYPTGTPTVIAPFIILIETVSYLARLISLGMRLFANMFAGHSLVKILMSFLWIFINSNIPLIGLPVLLLILVIFILELGIAYLQAYVFTTLSNMYLEDAIALGH